MKILIVDNTVDPGSLGCEDLRRNLRTVLGSHRGVKIDVRRAPHMDLPDDPSLFDRVIVSGSKTSALESAPWISALDAFIKRVVEMGKPFLGVCYGHQALARAFGGARSVRRAAKGEFGWTKIELTRESELTKGLASSFYSFSSHFEEVAELPTGFALLARSNLCAIQAMRLEGRPVFGIQFHPERNIPEAERTFLERKKNGDHGLLINPGGSRKYHDPWVGKLIFENFLGLGTRD